MVHDCYLVGAEQLHEPAPLIRVPLELSYLDPFYRSFLEHAPLYLHHGIVAYHEPQGLVLVMAFFDLGVPANEAVFQPVHMIELRAREDDAVLDYRFVYPGIAREQVVFFTRVQPPGVEYMAVDRRAPCNEVLYRVGYLELAPRGGLYVRYGLVYLRREDVYGDERGAGLGVFGLLLEADYPPV